MQIYVTHSRDMNYREELYAPIQASAFSHTHRFIFPHEHSDAPYDSRALILERRIDLVLAEVSLKSTAQGVEIGWADARGIPIAFLYKADAKPSNSLKKVSSLWVPYGNSAELISGIERVIQSFH